MLNDGEIDCANVTRSYHFNQGYESFKDAGAWAFNCNIELLQTNINTLDYIPLILFDDRCHYHNSATQGLNQLKIANKVVYISESLSVTQSLVMVGHGITTVAYASLSLMTQLTNDDIGF